ncbi:stage VI sporulation protein F [Allobacillus sp. SKP2-8]|uniref:stage VI sporulation protein F n=1 Tax=unclassified Allobacillus TaxID=2628859 RepID=UPI001184468B|nr:stage VI sporulation protein F [Allobacillus sp. SKP2-8]TSJ69023.1 stage VI sporulation protein F [Allobacillus sp. SKP2-8]
MKDDVTNSIMDHLSKKADISPQEIMQVANAMQQANFSDENTVRNLVRKLGKIANRPVTKEKEDRIVELVTKKNQTMDANMLQQIFKK